MNILMTVLADVPVTGLSSAAVSKTGPSAEGFLTRSYMRKLEKTP